MLTVSIDDSAVRLKLDQMPDKIRDALRLKSGILAERLQSYIKSDKLRGQVLHRRSGLLGDLMFYTVKDTPDGIIGTVSTSENTPYAAIHEYGKVFDRMVSVAWGKPMKHPHEVTFHYPERSFMRTGLADMREEIVTGLRDAVMKAVEL